MTKGLLILILGCALLISGCGGSGAEDMSASPEADDNPTCETVEVYKDGDGDGFGDPTAPLTICQGDPIPDGHVADGTDCNDGAVDIYPGSNGPDVCGQTINVTNTAQLQNALDTASPGSVIKIAQGLYSGEFHVRVSGEPTRPITICGPPDRSAILDGNFNISNWQGVLTIESRQNLIVENLEIRNAQPEGYGVLIGAASKNVDGCNTIQLRNLHVHDVGEEIIKIQGRNTSDILVENCIVHTNQDWSAIDIQGHWGGTPPYDDKPKKVVIRDNLIYDIVEFAGIGNEFADNIQAYNNVILGCRMGLDIGCGNYNIVSNNLITSYAYFNTLKKGNNYKAIDLSSFPIFTEEQIAGFRTPEAMDGIALSGNYMALVYDNEIVDCRGNGDMILSYEHRVSNGVSHNSRYGHRANLFFRNKIHDNEAYYTIREYDKQAGGVSYDEMYFNNLFYNNHSTRNIIFEHSQGLLFFNNTIVDGDNLNLLEASTDALVKNNIFIRSDYHLSPDATGSDIGPNHIGTDTHIFADYPNADFHLAKTIGAGSIDTGEDLQSLLQPIFDTYLALADTEYAFDGGAGEKLAFFEDFDGEIHDIAWDMGAFAVPR